MNFIDLAIKSILAGTMGFSAIYLLRKSSASTRHVAMFLTLIGVSLLPLVSFVLPRWHVPFIRLNEAATGVAQSQVAQVAAAPTALPARAVAPTGLDPLTVLMVIWAIGAGILCTRMLIKLIRLARAERSLVMSIDPGLQALVVDRCRESGRHVLLLEGLDKEPPMTWGHYRPVLVLPGDARTWPVDRLNSVVLHELAHIERGDWLASVFSQLACAVYWFNPFVWILRRWMEAESETAADDRVLSMGVSATQYASHLVEVSKDLIGVRSSTQVALAMARTGRLDRRIRAILEARRCRISTRGSVTLGLAAVIVGIIAALGAAAPTVISRTALIPPDPTTMTENAGATSGSHGDNADSSDKSSVVSTRAGSGRVTEARKPAPVHSHTPPPATNVRVATKTPPAAHPQRMASNSKLITAKSSGSHGAEASVDLDDASFDGATASEVRKASKEASAEVEKAIKEAGVEIDASTKEAMRDLAKSPLNTKGFIEGIRKVTEVAAKAGLMSAGKTANTQIAAAMKELAKSGVLPSGPPKKPKH